MKHNQLRLASIIRVRFFDVPLFRRCPRSFVRALSRARISNGLISVYAAAAARVSRDYESRSLTARRFLF